MFVCLLDLKDVQGMVDVINFFIKCGDIMVYQILFIVEWIINYYIQFENLLLCYVVIEDKIIFGFQVLMWVNDLVNDLMLYGWVYIVSFVLDNSVGKGIGYQLFEVIK